MPNQGLSGQRPSDRLRRRSRQLDQHRTANLRTAIAQTVRRRSPNAAKVHHGDRPLQPGPIPADQSSLRTMACRPRSRLGRSTPGTNARIAGRSLPRKSDHRLRETPRGKLLDPASHRPA
uniref:(northern house mosquito) hypothetical protein n=1 Tax=Culex pipiens TaxID=7175 RepID=A0A8D8BBH0_CULPI